MDQNKRKSAAAWLLCFAMLLSSLLLPAMSVLADGEAPSLDTVITGAYHYASSGSPEDTADTCYFSNGWFTKSSYQYNSHLATASLSLALSSGRSHGSSLADMSRNVKELLTSLGFTDIAVNEDYMSAPSEHSIGVAVGQKKIRTPSGEFTLLAVAPRSSGYGKEWADNFTVGAEGMHEGFSASADKIVTFLRGYIKTRAISGQVKLWTAGYSRGGAVANLLGGQLDILPKLLGIPIAAEDVFVYTFAAPRGAPPAVSPKGEVYRNIFNLLLEYDVVPMVAPAGWGFERYGVDRPLSVHDGESRAEMLTLLEKLDRGVYDKLLSEEEGDDPARFTAKRFAFGGELKTVDIAGGTATTQTAFLTERLNYVALTVLGNRVSYTASYASILQDMLSFYYGLGSKEKEAFSAAIKQDGSLLTKTVVLIYTYHAFELFAERNPTAIEIDRQLDELEAFAEKISPAFYESLMDMSVYEALRGGIDLMVRTAPNAKIIGINYIWSMVCDVLKRMSGENLGLLLRNALDAAGADSALLVKMTDSTVTELLSVFVAGALFSSENEPLDGIFSENSAQLTMAATLLGNLNRVARAHSFELMMAWVRTEDTYYDKKEPAKLTILGDVSKTYDGRPVMLPAVVTDSGSPVTIAFKQKGAPDSAFQGAPPANAGEYTVRASVPDDLEHEAAFAEADFTVAKAKATVTASDMKKTYGEKDGTLSYTVDGLVEGDSLLFDISREAGEDAGSYAIKVLQTSVSKNYDLTFVNGSYVIERADIARAEVTLGEVLSESGSTQRQTLRSVTLDGREVTFTVTGDSAVAAGLHKMQITGVGNYEGTLEQEYYILGDTAEALDIRFDIRSEGDVPKLCLQSPVTELVRAAFDANELVRLAKGDGTAELWLAVTEDASADPQPSSEKEKLWLRLEICLMKRMSDGAPVKVDGLETPLRLTLELPKRIDRLGRRFFAEGSQEGRIALEASEGRLTAEPLGAPAELAVYYLDYCPICQTREPSLLGLCSLSWLGITVFLILTATAAVFAVSLKRKRKVRMKKK